MLTAPKPSAASPWDADDSLRRGRVWLQVYMAAAAVGYLLFVWPGPFREVTLSALYAPYLYEEWREVLRRAEEAASLSRFGICFLLLTAATWLRPRQLATLYADPRKRAWCLRLTLLVAAVEVSSISVLRRLNFFLILPIFIVPWLPTWIERSRRCGYYARVTAAFFVVSLLVRWLPGGYLPPFFSGIGGWTATIKNSPTVELNGIALVGKDGRRQWFSNGVSSPINFIDRHLQMMRRRGSLADAGEFYLETYRRRYDQLARGWYPTQRYLGGWACPGHSTYRMLDYRMLPPEEVASVQHACDTYDRETGKLIASQVRYSYDVQRR